MSRKVSEMTEAQRARERALGNAARAAKLREAKPWLPPYEPKAERGPTGSRPANLKEPYIPDGHELHGVSKLTKTADGAIWDKTKKHGGEPTPLPPGFDLPHRVSRFTAGDGSVIGQWSGYKVDEGARAAALLDAIRAHVNELPLALPPIDAPDRTDASTLTLYPLGDPHIGMLAWANEVGAHFDVKIAVRELCQAVRNLVARAPASERAIICNLGDFFHAQDDKQLTPTAGHKLDVDGRFGKVARAGLDMMTTVVRAALQKHAHVTLRNVPGNHDLGACFWIAEVLRREFANEPRVTVEEAFAPYQCDMFGKCMLVWCHTDGAKPEQISQLAANDWPEIWGATRFRYGLGGHIHSRKMIESPGFLFENFRTLAGKDAWHNWKGYRSGQSLCAITLDREWGEVSRITEGVERVRATILAQAA